MLVQSGSWNHSLLPSTALARQASTALARQASIPLLGVGRSVVEHMSGIWKISVSNLSWIPDYYESAVCEDHQLCVTPLDTVVMCC